MKYPNGSESVLSPRPFSQLVRVKKVPCTDGKARTAEVSGQPDSFFSIPAYVRIQGHKVYGFLTMAPTYRQGVKEGYVFYANKFAKNGGLLPEKYPWDDEDFKDSCNDCRVDCKFRYDNYNRGAVARIDCLAAK